MTEHRARAGDRTTGGERVVRAVAAQMILALALVFMARAAVGAAESVGSLSPQVVSGLMPMTNLVFVKAGSFVRANQQRVRLTRDFWIGKYEVTQGEFEAVTGKNPSHFAGDARRPVEKVSYQDAVAYCLEVTRRERTAGRLPASHEYRLPTEAEWEYACRAGSGDHFSFGNDESAAAEYAWTDENAEGAPHPVGQRRPNAWGLHDMHGNVWEWCSDWFAQEYPPGEQTDPTGPASGKYKVFRGGSWNHQAKFARSGNRFVMAPANGIFFVGFRMVLAPAGTRP